MRLTLLGSGDAAGIPLYGCDCNHCTAAAKDPGLRRTASSALLESDGQRLLLDAGQLNLCERFPAGTIDAIFLTHFHVDHLQGLFHLRWGIGESIPVYTPPDPEGCGDLYKHPGILEFVALRQFDSRRLGDLQITPLPLNHSKPTYGYLFSDARWQIAYLTDTKGLPIATSTYLADRSLDLMVVDCSFAPGVENKGHNNLDDVLQIDKLLAPARLVLTHIGHGLDVWLRENPRCLPPHISVARDGMRVFPYS
ncbi:MAG: phosphonate metabolism protein PhnP [gamma proteobacterium symbiont of Ctena orbiculata]|nr:MAG: phosphonate metabolism protein PhnP [gamma proteobacterium symbiont of Ctena orbiculata]PVV10372.1 MAG: phosphonate metabolism protein PhnP [gamma proteobacterium symbiont of Ctena orbiculata]PVV14539.1 MAG: phosphonate metabolism protein PhnP [gamma proteobacterium symbiont of Ctena orbiculata]PVV19945.1 MAG: phosphonate metabolism protein PhnP [gamma proteobacterium symbiont of Ctena orbiculata]